MKAFAIGCALGLVALLGSPAHAADSLYIGDDSNYTVKRFDADTGAFLGTFVSSGSGGVNGLRGLLFEHPSASGCGDLLVVNQNVNFNLNGEVLRYDGTTGAFLKALIPAANRPRCVSGDCDGTKTVGVNDIITLLNIALGTAQPLACAHGVPSSSQINIALIIQAVNSALHGCGVG